ncbi:MarR family winged helix-turn-helix transcriptional regulator [Pseudonocardia sp. KRD291]|uniref:MarR family winged helix-turn-helix transcriptional regulator n=1 Tax=Pseudonocardia sp. KRD291 TaxID=2792007 RepID=UPI001C5C7BD0|nr:MarR family winged helix-turn-helix transcriptional regulator [Pseudonocardia sp. KRD291]MBW0104684.1 winged helix-turn-helix transcriptional regulator [Pseudonocardia sp. KRD291]
MNGADPGLEPVHLLRAVTVELDRAGAAFGARHGLGPNDLRAVIALLDADRAGTPAGPGWLGTQLGINSASVTALVDRLVRAGHVRRVPDEHDGRKVQLVVTEGATALGWAFFGPLIGGVLEVLDGLDDDGRAAVTTFLRGVADVVADVRDG